MAFTPPEFAIFLVNTLNLDTELSIRLKRYKIVDEANSKQSSLEILIARTNEVINCKSDRKSAKEVFNKLVNEFRDVLAEKNEEQNKQATAFLLGALIHRYFRLINEYKKFNGWLLGVKASSVQNCTLFQAIRVALQLGKEFPGDFLIKDLEILDVTTIVQSLEVFRENMLAEDKDKTPRYKKYEHLDDPKFKDQLDEIINEHSKLGAITIKQFKAINFLQSLAQCVSKEQQAIEKELQNWNKLALKEFGKLEQLDLTKLQAHINTHVKEEVLQKKILQLLDSENISTKIGSLTYDSFFKTMLALNNAIAGYRLLGGYALLLESPEIIDKMRFSLLKALGIELKPQALTDEDKLVTIQLLIQYLKDEPQLKLDFTFFNGRNSMESTLADRELALSKKVMKEQENKTVETPTASLTV
jgi:hypothetical protein